MISHSKGSGALALRSTSHKALPHEHVPDDTDRLRNARRYRAALRDVEGREQVRDGEEKRHVGDVPPCSDRVSVATQQF